MNEKSCSRRDKKDMKSWLLRDEMDRGNDWNLGKPRSSLTCARQKLIQFSLEKQEQSGDVWWGLWDRKQRGALFGLPVKKVLLERQPIALARSRDHPRL
jgi:hypothetical protein